MANNVKLLNIDDFIAQYENDPYLNGSYQREYAEMVDPDHKDLFLQELASGVESHSVLKELKGIQETLRQYNLEGYLQQTAENEFKLITTDASADMSSVVDSNGRLIASNKGQSYQTGIIVKRAHDIQGGHGGVSLGLNSLNNRVPTIAMGINGKLSGRLTFVNAQEAILKNFLETLPKTLNSRRSKGESLFLGVSSAGSIAAQNVYMTSKAGVKKQDNPLTSGQSGENSFIDALRRERFNVKTLASELFPILDSEDDALMSEFTAAMSEVGFGLGEEFNKVYANIKKRHPSLFKSGKAANTLKPLFRNLYDMHWRNNVSGTNDEAFSNGVGDAGSRALIPGGNATTYSQRYQNIGIQHSVTQKMRRHMVPGVFTTKRATASGLKYAAPIPQKGDADQTAPYDAGVPVIFLTDKQLAAAAPEKYRNMTARDGQTIVTGEMGDMLKTSFIKHDQTISKKEIDDFIERRLKDLDKITQLMSKHNQDSKPWKKLKDQAEDIRALILNRQEVARTLYDAEVKLKGWERVSAPNFAETEDGGYIVSADKVITGFNSGERGVGGNGERSAIVIGQNSLFSDTKIKNKDGNERSLRDMGVQAIMSPEQQDARKTMQFAMTQLQYALQDMVKLGKGKEFWGELEKDSKDPKVKAAEGLKFILGIAKPNSDYTQFDLEDSAEVYREFYQKFDEKIVNYLIDYVDTLRDSLGGNMGLGKAFKLDGDGNLLFSGNPYVGYTSLKKDINDRYEGLKFGGASLSTGATSLGNLLRTSSVNIPESDRRKLTKGVDEIVDDVVGQIKPPKENIDELEKRRNDTLEALHQMQVGQKIDVNSLTPEKGYIVAGWGSGYTVDLNDVEAEKREGATVTNEEKTLTYLANKAIQDLAQKYHMDPSQFQLVIDPGDGVNIVDTQTFDDGTTYGYGSNLLILPKNVTNWEGIRGDLDGRLIRALQNKDPERTAKTLSQTFKTVWADVNTKDGPDYKRLMKTDAPNSFTMHSVGINPSGILSKKQYETANAYDRKVSDIASFGSRVSPKVLRELYKNALRMKRGRRNLTEDDLRAAVQRLGIFPAADVQKAKASQLIDYLVSAQTVGSKAFINAVNKGTLEGLRAFLGRFPFFSMYSDLLPSELWADETVGDESMILPYILADMQNADFDGDHEVAFLPALDADAKILFDASKETVEKAGRIQLYNKFAKQELENRENAKKGGTPVFKKNATEAVPNIDFDYAAAIATRVQKPFVGLFSNMNQEFKEMSKKAGLGDLSALGKQGASDTEKEMAVRAMLVKVMFDAMEQDTISAKKLVNRLMAAKVKNSGVKAPSQGLLLQFYGDAVSDLTSIIDDMRSGNADPEEIISRLGQMGVFDVDAAGKAILNSRDTRNIFSMIESTAGGTDILKRIIPNYQSFADAGDDIEAQASWGGVHGEDIANAMKPLAGYMQRKGAYTGPATTGGLLQATSRHEHTPEKRSSSPYNMTGKTPANKHQKAYYERLDEENRKLIDGVDPAAAQGAQPGAAGAPSAPGGGSDGDPFSRGKMERALNSPDMKSFYPAPISTTNITGDLIPYNAQRYGAITSPVTVYTVLGSYNEKTHRFKKNLGYTSQKEMLEATQGGAEPTDIAGHVTGSALQFHRKMLGILKGRAGASDITTVKEMMEYARAHRGELEKEDDPDIKEALFYLDEFDKDVENYELYMKGIHGASGLNDAKSYLASRGDSSFVSGLERQIEAGAKSYKAFVSSLGEEVVSDRKGRGVLSPLNEVGFIGALDNNASKKYHGRNDTLTLVQGEDGTYHLVSIDDKHRSKEGGPITEGELAQQVMNLVAARAEMDYAKQFMGKGGFAEWFNTDRVKALFKKNGRYSAFNPEDFYEMLTKADDVKAYVSRLTPSGADYLEINPTAHQTDQIMEEIRQVEEHKKDTSRLSELLNSIVRVYTAPGTIVSAEAKGSGPFAGMTQQQIADNYSKSLKSLRAAKLERAKAQYQADMAQYEGLSDDEKKERQGKLDEASEEVRSLEGIIKKAERLLPKKVREEAIGGKKEDLYPELRKEGDKDRVDITSGQEYLDYVQAQRDAQARRYADLKKTISVNESEIKRRARERRRLGSQLTQEQSDSFDDLDAASKLAIENAQKEIKQVEDAGGWGKIADQNRIDAVDLLYAGKSADENQKQAVANAKLLNKQLQDRVDLLERIKEIEYDLSTLEEGDASKAVLEKEKAVAEKKVSDLDDSIESLEKEATVKTKGGEEVSLGLDKDQRDLMKLQSDQKYADYVAKKQEDALADYKEARKTINEIDKAIALGDIKVSSADTTVEDDEAWKKTRESLKAQKAALVEKAQSSDWAKKTDANAFAIAKAEADAADIKAAEQRQKDINNAYKKIIEERIILAENLKRATYLLEHPDAGASKDSAEAAQKAIDSIREQQEKNEATTKRLEESFNIKAEDFEAKSAPEEVRKELKEKSDETAETTEKLIEQEQQRALAEYTALQQRRLALEEQIRKRRVANEAKGTSRAQIRANILLNKRDQEEQSIIDAKLNSGDWTERVGGAEAMAEANEKIAASAAQAEANIAAYNKEINPSIIDQFKISVKGWFDQMMRGQLVWKILGMIQQSIKKIFVDATKLDAILTNLQIVTGGTRESTKALISTYSVLAGQLSSTTSEVASAANSWLRQGYSVSETTDLITASLQLSKLGMIDSANATAYLTSMLKGFKLEAGDAIDVVDKLTKVDMSAATSAGDIAEALRQFAATAQLSGLDVDESIAMATTIMDVSQKDASSTGNALKTMLSRFGNVKAGTYSGMNITGDQNETTEALNDIEKVLRKLGISLRSSNLEFREFDDVLDDIAEKWATLDSVSKNAIATAMAGTRQRESFLVLMENYDKYQQFLETSQEAEGTAAEKYKAYEDSLEASQKRLSAAWEEFAGKTEVVDFLKSVLSVAEKLVKVIPYLGRVMVRFLSGKAATYAISLFGKSGIPKMLEDLKAGGFKKFYEDKIGPTRGWNAKESKAGLLENQITKGVEPIMTVLNRIADNTAKTAGAAGKPASGAKPATAATATPDAGAGEAGGTSAEAVATDESPSAEDWDAWTDKGSKAPTPRNYKKAREEVEKEYLSTNPDKRKLLAELKKEEKEEKEERKKLKKQRLKEQKRQAREQAKAQQRELYAQERAIDPALADGTRLSAIRVDKDGNYTAKGRKGFISKEEYNDLVRRRDASLEEGRAEYDAAKKRAKTNSTVNAVASGIGGFMTAETNNVHTNAITGEKVTRETDNAAAKFAMKAGTGIATAIGAYFLGPVGAQVAGGIADALNAFLFGPLFQSATNEMLDRFEYAEKKAQRIESIQSALSSVIELASKDILTSGDYKSLVEAEQKFREELSKEENSDIKNEFLKYANKALSNQEEGNEYQKKSLNELTNLSEMTSSERKKTAYALKIAQMKQQNQSSMAQYEKTISELTKNITNYSIQSIINSGEGPSKLAFKRDVYYNTSFSKEFARKLNPEKFEEYYNKELEASVEAYKNEHAGEPSGNVLDNLKKGAMERAGKLVGEDFASLQFSEKWDMLQKTRDNLSESDNPDDQRVVKRLDKILNYFESIDDAVNSMRSKLDVQSAQEAILEFSYGKNADGSNKTLLDLSPSELKKMGLDQIVFDFAEYLQEQNGGMASGASYFVEDENGNKKVREEAKTAIIKALKLDDSLYSIITGQTTTLMEAMNMPEGSQKTSVLESFAAALGVTAEELDSCVESFGNLSLSQVSADAESLNQSFSDIQKIIVNIGSGSQNWVDTMQMILKSYPDLITYASDYGTLMSGFASKAQSYSDLQIKAQMDEIMTGESSFAAIKKEMMASLSPEEQEQFDALKLNNLNDLQSYISNNSGALSGKLSEAVKKVLANITLSSSIEYDQAKQFISNYSYFMDKQINNLTEQKEAMQEINSQREYENKLIEAKLKMEQSMKEKKRVWREGVGWVYEEDQSSIKEAKENLDSVEKERDVSALEQQIKQLTTDKEYLSSALTDDEDAQKIAFMKMYAEAGGVTGDNLIDSTNQLESAVKTGLEGIKQSADKQWDKLFDTLQSNKQEARKGLKDSYDHLMKMKDAYDKAVATGDSEAINKAAGMYNTALSDYQETYRKGINNGYWSSGTFDENNVAEFGGAGFSQDMEKAGVGGAGFKKKEEYQDIYVKTSNGWKKFEFNVGTSAQVPAVVWNDFYDKGKMKGDFYNSNWETNKPSANSPHLVLAYDGGSGEGAAIYEAAQSLQTSGDFADWIRQNTMGPVVAKSWHNGNWVRIIGGAIYPLTNGKSVSEDEVPEDVREAGGSFERGSLSVGSGNVIPSLINEAGTEAIVTPNGTITALPSASGVVPADITRNLWQLGGLSPYILRELRGNYPSESAKASASTDNSVNINTVSMTVNADGGFDAEQFVSQLKTIAALSKNNRN